MPGVVLGVGDSAIFQEIKKSLLSWSLHSDGRLAVQLPTDICHFFSSSLSTVPQIPVSVPVCLTLRKLDGQCLEVGRGYFLV